MSRKAASTDDDMGELWREYRRAQQERRAKRLQPRSDEIEELRRSGFDVRELTPYQFRIDSRLDLYPIHRRWHDVKTGKRGNYRQPKDIAMRLLRGSK